jgi:hypothetical protein
MSTDDPTLPGFGVSLEASEKMRVMALRLIELQKERDELAALLDKAREDIETLKIRHPEDGFF